MPGRMADGRLASKGRLSNEWASRRVSVIEKNKSKKRTGGQPAYIDIICAKNYDKMERKIHGVPEKNRRQVARYALDVMGIRMDKMTKEQKRYQASS